MENAKIKNCTPQEYDGIKFKSTLEARLYKTLKELNIDVKYEPKTITLNARQRATVPFYNRTKRGGFKLDTRPLNAITYTPDFWFTYNNVEVIIEAKGMENDVFPLKRNLFRKWLELYTYKAEKPAMYFEVRTKTELLKALKIVEAETPFITKLRHRLSYLPSEDYSKGASLLEERDFTGLEHLIIKVIKRLQRAANNNLSNNEHIDWETNKLAITNLELFLYNIRHRHESETK